MTPITAWTFLQLALLCYYFRRPTLRCVAPHRPVDLLPVRPGNRISRFGNRSLMEISAPRSRCSTAKSRVQTDRDELCGCGNSKAAIQIMAMESTVRLRSILLLLLPPSFGLFHSCLCGVYFTCWKLHSRMSICVLVHSDKTKTSVRAAARPQSVVLC